MSEIKTVTRESLGLATEGLSNTTFIQAGTPTIKVLNVSGVPDTGEWFPLWAQVMAADVELINNDMYPSISTDPVYNIPVLESAHFSDWALNDGDRGHTVLAEIKIDKYLPEWVELGKALCGPDAGDDVLADDELMAATFVHHQLLAMTGCVAVYCWQW